MRHSKKSPTRGMVQLNPWTLLRARSATPYLRQVVASLREAYLEHRASAQRVEKLEHRHGRQTTTLLVDIDDSKKLRHDSHERIVEAVSELATLGAVPGPMHQGIAFLPVVNNKRLAWLIVDIFDDATLSGWRWHGEPESIKRPISEWEALN